MKKIDKLVFKNFKFFADEQVFDFSRKNILLYGENGSGKSSLYWGLYTFLQSSIKDDIEVKKYFDKDDAENLINKFIDEADKDDAFVSLDISDENDIAETFKISFTTINTNKLTNTNIKKANSTSDFINYRLLSRFYDFRNSEEIDIWELFEKEILDYITIDGKNLQVSWSSLKNGLSKTANKYPPMHSQTYKDLQVNLTLFNQVMKTFLANIVAKTNILLSNNFKENISIDIKYENSTYNDFVDGSTTKRNRLVKRPKIILKVKFNEKELFRPHTFLNEAKLTAIALSLRFAILKTRLVDEDILKILVLDDLLISLDMSHRLEVINIILTDEDLKDYQKIILTHDKAFFKMAKQKFNYIAKKKWKYFEMYVDIDNKTKMEKPFILPSRDYFEKAEYYLIKHDYSACANYLRKEAERLLKAIVCHHRDLSCSETKNLQTLIDKAKTSGSLSEKENIVERVRNLVNFNDFEKFIEFDLTQLESQEDKRTIGIIRTELKRFKDFSNNEIVGLKKTLIMLEEFKALILNPQSHDDTQVPLYKKELEDAIKNIKKLRDEI